MSASNRSPSAMHVEDAASTDAAAKLKAEVAAKAAAQVAVAEQLMAASPEASPEALKATAMQVFSMQLCQAPYAQARQQLQADMVGVTQFMADRHALANRSASFVIPYFHSESGKILPLKLSFSPTTLVTYAEIEAAKKKDAILAADKGSLFAVAEHISASAIDAEMTAPAGSKKMTRSRHNKVDAAALAPPTVASSKMKTRVHFTKPLATTASVDSKALAASGRRKKPSYEMVSLESEVNKLKNRYHSYGPAPEQYQEWYAPDQKDPITYCRVEVSELIEGGVEQKFLDIWFSTNTKVRYGEWHDLCSSKNTGNGENKLIYRFLDDNFFHINASFNTDASRNIGSTPDGKEVGERAEGVMVFRVTKGVASLQTLYENDKRGSLFRFFSVKNAKMGHPTEVVNFQDEKRIYRARLELHRMPIIDLYHCYQAIATKASIASATVLNDLVKKYLNFQLAGMSTCSLTLGQFLEELAKQNKKQRVAVQHAGTAQQNTQDDYSQFYKYFLRLSNADVDRITRSLEEGDGSMMYLPESDESVIQDVPLRPDQDENAPVEFVRVDLASKRAAQLKLNVFINRLTTLVYSRFLIRECDHAEATAAAGSGGGATSAAGQNAATASALKPYRPSH